MTAPRRLIRWLFTVPGMGVRSAWEVITWWESRRLAYNVVVGMVGLFSLVAFFGFITAANVLKPGEDAVEPMALLLAPFGVNFCYTLGWIGELALRLLGGQRDDRIAGPILLGVGFALSLLIVLLPAALWSVFWLIRQVHGH